MLKMKHLLELNIEELLVILGGKLPLSSFFESYGHANLLPAIYTCGDDERLMGSALLRLAIVCAAVKSNIVSGHSIDVYYEKLHIMEYLINELEMFAHMGSGITTPNHQRNKNGYITSYGIIDESQIKDGTEVTVLCSDNATVSIPRNLFNTYCCNR